MSRQSFRVAVDRAPADDSTERATCVVGGAELVSETHGDSSEAWVLRDGERVGTIDHGPAVPLGRGLRPETEVPGSMVRFELEGARGVVRRPGGLRRRLEVEADGRRWVVRSRLTLKQLREVDVADPAPLLMTWSSIRAREDQRFEIALLLLLWSSDLFRHLTLFEAT